MKSQKILYTSADVRKTIIDLFEKSKGRRVAITAFVGKGAEAYLPKPDGIELICWPKAGGTNPNALRVLMKKGIQVKFADNLHMKVYWTADQGAVITSANLSVNALGSGNLQELGILVPSDALDIDRIIQKIKPRSINVMELASLDVAHRRYQMINKGMKRESVKLPTFLEWYETPMRNENWRLGYWDEDIHPSLAAKRKTKELYEINEPRDFLSCKANRYKAHDLVLKFRLESNTPTLLCWLNVDFVERTDKSDKVYEAKYPYHAVQAQKSTYYSGVDLPFKIDDGFKRAFTVAIRKYGATRFRKEDPSIPSNELIELIKKGYEINQ
jgi:hypothetical protein